MNCKGIARNAAILICVAVIIVAGVAVYFVTRPAPPPLPGELKLSDLVIGPTEVLEGDNVTISVNVTNVGETNVTETIALYLNGLVEATKEVTLAGGASTTVEFVVTKPAGDYTVAIGIGTLAGVFNVLVPGELELSGLVIRPTQVAEGDNVTISVNVTNVGENSVTGPITLMLNDEVEDSKEVTLEPGESKIVTFIVTKDVGDYTVAIDTFIGAFNVLVPGELELSGLVIGPTEVLEGDNVTISVNVTNVGETNVTGTVTLLLNGTVEDSKEITLGGGETTTVTFIVTKDVGNYSIAIDTLTGAFTVLKRPKIYVISDVGGRGDLSFNDMAFKGGEEAEEDFGVKMVELISETEADYLKNLRDAAKDPDTILIVGAGFLLSDAVSTVADEYPDKNFMIIDGFVPNKTNVMNVLFEEHKGSALVGALGALLAAHYDKPHIGAVLGIEIPILWKFEIGYKWGARWATEWLAQNKPDEWFNYTKDFVLWTYTGTFSDITKGYTAALPMYEADAVAVYNIAGPLGLGINSVVHDIAMRDDLEMGPPFWIGVDANQDWINPGFVIASMMKRVDRGVYYATQLVKEGKFRDVVAETDGLVTIGIGTEWANIPMEGISVSTLADLDDFIEMGVKAEELTGEPVLPGPPDWIRDKVEAMRVAQPSWIWDAVAELEEKISTGEVEVPLAWTADDIAYWRDILG